ncbi:Voltage-dependent calcium channel subunit alpha-2/delta-1 [Geodia barretti]|uniref:Voltage-dependent calcium channel subunit alpha-2/delta-1 n=1 Tax=Geodia barretti TaxID=519541 RepID=A0AA35RC30_GEOBA|nr:Voltage-dependent calcium channel subunit alpha-2/delta-1 [Geodia barretti]
MIKLVFLVFLALSLSEGDSEGASADRLQELAEELSGLVWQKWSNFSLSIYLEAQQNLSSEAVEEVNGSVIAEEVATNLSDSLSRFRHFLNETASFAESLYSNHRNQNCCSSVCQYGTEYSQDLCSMACNRSSIRYTSSGRGFGIGMETGWNGTRQCVMGSWGHQTCTPPGDEEEAAVHIPRDVHEEDPDVLCFVQWTEELSRHFTSTHSFLPYSDLTQYIGTDSRLLRFYPPFDWSALSQCNRCPLSLQDTFELGRRPWYTNTVTGDKFIVVLLDVSGSMAGFQSLLAKTTISQLLRALTSNDYFLIIQVGEGERTKNVGCFSEKTRATPENVLVASQDIMLLPDTNNVGRAHFSQPLQDYLRLLGNSTECHRVLIVFSDGEKETPLPVDLVRANNKDLEVQIFSFLVGGGPDDANMKIVSCQNRGRMGKIREYFDIIPAVLLITDSLALPTSRHIHYTLYRGISGSYELAMGLPLWKSSTNETFGIVGFDIPYQQLLTDALQKYRVRLHPLSNLKCFSFAVGTDRSLRVCIRS